MKGQFWAVCLCVGLGLTGIASWQAATKKVPQPATESRTGNEKETPPKPAKHDVAVHFIALSDANLPENSDGISPLPTGHLSTVEEADNTIWEKHNPDQVATLYFGKNTTEKIILRGDETTNGEKFTFVTQGRPVVIRAIGPLTSEWDGKAKVHYIQVNYNPSLNYAITTANHDCSTCPADDLCHCDSWWAGRFDKN
ncbi:MAG: hypothetical protein OHK0029_35530 [Armatimonadaceae bacterium]